MATQPGHTPSWATTTNPEVLSPATQSLPDIGEGLDPGAYAKACVLRLEENWWSSPSTGTLHPVCFRFCFEVIYRVSQADLEFAV